MSSKTSHPNIAKVTRQTEAVDVLIHASKYYDAWRWMKIIMYNLKPQDKQREDFKKLLKEINYALRRLDSIRALNAPDLRLRRIMLARNLDKGFQPRFASLLWDCEILTDGGYASYDPTGGKSSLDVDIKLGDRKLDNIR